MPRCRDAVPGATLTAATYLGDRHGSQPVLVLCGGLAVLRPAAVVSIQGLTLTARAPPFTP